MQSTFELKLTTNDIPEIITVRVQNISPFKLADMMAVCISPANGTYKTGTFVQECVKNEVILSPKNLIERVEESDVPFEAIKNIFNEVLDFINNPRVYRAKELASEAKVDTTVEDLGDSV